MGLGLVLIGLAMAAAVVSVGQLWQDHQNLQDALNNAALVMESTSQQSRTVLATLVQQNGPFPRVTVTSFSVSGANIVATVTTPVNPWFWAHWMGANPVQVSAAT